MHRRVEFFAPVVEVAGHDQRRVGRHFSGDEIGQALDLAHPAGVHQAQVRDHGMQGAAVPLHRHVQQAALLETVVADVVVADVAERPARQQGIAMLAVAGDGIAAVGHVIALGGQELGLALFGPAEPGALELARVAAVVQAHLLQEHQVGVEGLDTQAQVVDLQALPRPDTAHAFVDVVRGHTQALVQAGVRRQVARLQRVHVMKRGSCNTASALLGEKQRSAASRQGNHSKCRCSRGLSVTGVPAGTVRPKTCSVLWVMPGA